MPVVIREMHCQDYPAAYALWKSLPGMGLSSADERKAIRSFLQKNPQTCFVAEHAGTLIGSILGGSDGRRGYIYHLAVDHRFQKQGVGRQLVQTCLDALKAQGIEKCHLFVISSNQSGRDFWKRLGWQQRDDIIVMSKNMP